jgi:RNA polymerase sigma-70 factor (ECF subfamily)
MFRRRRAVAHEPFDEMNGLPVLEEAPDVIATLERQQRLDMLIEAVASLPERCRHVMMLRHLDELPGASDAWTRQSAGRDMNETTTVWTK